MSHKSHATLLRAGVSPGKLMSRVQGGASHIRSHVLHMLRASLDAVDSLLQSLSLHGIPATVHSQPVLDADLCTYTFSKHFIGLGGRQRGLAGFVNGLRTQLFGSNAFNRVGMSDGADSRLTNVKFGASPQTSNDP